MPAAERSGEGGISVPRTMRIAVAAAVAACLVLAPTATPVVPATGNGDAAKLRKAVTVQGMRAHEQALQNIASANGNTRASGTPGFDRSVEYVVGQLEAAGYHPQVQPFDFPFFEETGPAAFQRISPSPRTYTEPEEFGTMTYSGNGDVTGVM